MTVKIYSKDGCIYCVKAKDFFDDLGVKYTEIKLDPSKKDEYKKERDRLIKETNHKTFPWIFIGDTFIGGFTDLKHKHSTLKLEDDLRKIGIEIDMDF